jgi:hypothetical protein
MNAPYKGVGPKAAKYAVGGPVITQPSRFMKGEPSREGAPLAPTKSKFIDTPDQFRTDTERQDYEKKSKGGEQSKTEGDAKSLPPIKPRT